MTLLKKTVSPPTKQKKTGIWAIPLLILLGSIYCYNALSRNQVARMPAAALTEKKVKKKPPPFPIGEELTYKLRWGIIPAGYAVFTVEPATQIKKQPAWHFSLKARTNSFADTFYRVRIRIDSYTDPFITHSLQYEEHKQEGHRRKEVKVTFDWKKKKAQYRNYDDIRKPISILPGTVDPLGIFYYLRARGMSEKSKLKLPVTDGKHCAMGKAKVIRRETIKVGGKKYDSLLIEPEMKRVGGVFNKSKKDKLQIWIALDQSFTPLRFRSKVMVGHFSGELFSRRVIKQPKKKPTTETSSPAIKQQKEIKQ